MKKLFLLLGMVLVGFSINAKAQALTLVSEDTTTGSAMVINIDAIDASENITVNVTYNDGIGTTTIYAGIAVHTSATDFTLYNVVIPRSSFMTLASSGIVTVSAINRTTGLALGAPVSFGVDLVPGGVNPRRVDLAE